MPFTCSSDLRRIENAIGVRFRNRAYLERALTHGSFEDRAPGETNERLEFLGDAVLKLAIAEHLFTSYPDFTEGDLSELLARAVSEEALARVSERLGLGRALKIGKGLELAGGREQASLLADAFEALLGAVFLDRGYRVAADLASRELEGEIEEALAGQGVKNYKALLQESLQRKAKAVPTYRVVGEEGPAHRRTFTVEVVFDGRVLGAGRGRSKKEAEQAAAKAALNLMETSLPE